MKRLFALLLCCLPLFTLAAPSWQDVERQAKGQTVYFNAWGGSDATNRYLAWVTAEMRKRYGVTVRHVKIADAADTVKRITAEKTAGRHRGGSVDLVWINGENFRRMKTQGLLGAPFAQSLPNWRYVDTSKPVAYDFAEPVNGLESPWGTAQLTFIANRRTVPTPPQSMQALLAYAKAHPGRVTYPKPPSFHGITFLKQAMLELNTDRSVFSKPATPQAFAKATAPLWRYLDSLHPHLWRQGKAFPASAEKMQQMLNDGELQISLTFNPNEAAYLISQRRLPASVYSYAHKGGTIANVHFVAIPYNANARAGALVLANFLLSPEAQARKADIKQWGDPTVLSPAKTPAPYNKLLTSSAPGALPVGSATLPEPHGSWAEMLKREWIKRYGA